MPHSEVIPRTKIFFAVLSFLPEAPIFSRPPDLLRLNRTTGCGPLSETFLFRQFLDNPVFDLFEQELMPAVPDLVHEEVNCIENCRQRLRLLIGPFLVKHQI